MNTGKLAQTAYERALRMIDEGAPRREILNHLATTAERASLVGGVASILVLDNEGLLRNGASPNVPSDYLDAIDRLKPDANLGTYYRAPHSPTPQERETVRLLASAAARAIASRP